jgi:hypothetical protein
VSKRTGLGASATHAKLLNEYDAGKWCVLSGSQRELEELRLARNTRQFLDLMDDPISFDHTLWIPVDGPPSDPWRNHPYLHRYMIGLGEGSDVQDATESTRAPDGSGSRNQKGGTGRPMKDGVLILAFHAAWWIDENGIPDPRTPLIDYLENLATARAFNISESTVKDLARKAIEERIRSKR